MVAISADKKSRIQSDVTDQIVTSFEHWFHATRDLVIGFRGVLNLKDGKSGQLTQLISKEKELPRARIENLTKFFMLLRKQDQVRNLAALTAGSCSIEGGLNSGKEMSESAAIYV